MMMASDVSGFNDKPFNVNHKWTDWKQSDSREIALSSNRKWRWRSVTRTARTATDPEQILKERRTRKPLSWIDVDTNWDLSLKYELSHCSAQPDIPTLRSSRCRYDVHYRRLGWHVRNHPVNFVCSLFRRLDFIVAFILLIFSLIFLLTMP